MSAITRESLSMRDRVAINRPALLEVLSRYRASRPRLFGSVARGDAVPSSDLDILVDLEDGAGNELLRLAGIGEELSDLLGVRVDVVSAALLRDAVSATALRDAVAV